MRNEITLFSLDDKESLFEESERCKELLKKFPPHDILVCVQLETFYNGFLPTSRNPLDVSSRGVVLSKPCTDALELIGCKKTNYERPTARIITLIKKGYMFT